VQRRSYDSAQAVGRGGCCGRVAGLRAVSYWPQLTIGRSRCALPLGRAGSAEARQRARGTCDGRGHWARRTALFSFRWRPLSPFCVASRGPPAVGRLVWRALGLPVMILCLPISYPIARRRRHVLPAKSQNRRGRRFCASTSRQAARRRSGGLLRVCFSKGASEGSVRPVQHARRGTPWDVTQSSWANGLTGLWLVAVLRIKRLLLIAASLRLVASPPQ
jgi:hypothetical protein